jgi:hypothetical protein
MPNVVEGREVVSRRYLEQLQINLKRDGDDRLACAMADCDIVRFTLEWITCVVAAILLTLFVRSAFLGHSLDCFFIMFAGAVLFLINRVTDQRLVRHYNRRFYESIPEDLRWCFHRQP